jgi:hypothetical protein
MKDKIYWRELGKKRWHFFNAKVYGCYGEVAKTVYEENNCSDIIQVKVIFKDEGTMIYTYKVKEVLVPEVEAFFIKGEEG